MQTMNWLEDHVGSIEAGIDLINRFHWFLSTEEIKTDERSVWIVKGGEAVLFTTDSRDAVDAFLYGMALAYAGIPDPLFDQLVAATKSWLE